MAVETGTEVQETQTPEPEFKVHGPVDFYNPGSPTPEPEEPQEPAEPEDKTDAPGSETPEEGQTTEPADPAKPGEPTPEPDYSWLTEATEGQVKDRSGLEALVKDYNQIKADADKPKEPQFQTEAHKKAYEFIQKFGDKDKVAAASRYLQVQSFDLEKAPKDDILFQNFLLENPNISSDRARKVFDGLQRERFPERFQQVEDEETGEMKPAEIPEHKQYLYDQEVDKATENISKIRNEYEEGSKVNYQEQAQQEQQQLVTQAIESELPNFKGMNMSFDFSGDDAKILAADPNKPDSNLSVTVPQEKLEEFKNAVTNPGDYWAKVFNDDKGQFSPQNWINFVFKTMFGDEILSKTAKFSHEQAKIEYLKKNKNIPDKELNPDPNQGPEQAPKNGIRVIGENVQVA